MLLRNQTWLKNLSLSISLALGLLTAGGSSYAAQCDIQNIDMGGHFFDSPGTMAATPDGQWLIIVDENAGDLKILNTTSQQIVTSLYLNGLEPSGLTVAPDGTRLYIGGAFGTGIAVVDSSAPQPANWQLLDTWSINGDFTALLFDPTTPRLFAGDREVAGVRVLSEQGAELATLTVPNDFCGLPRALALQQTQLFVACETADTVAVFDLNSMSHVKNLSVGKSPTALIAHPSQPQLFTANTGDGSLSMINSQQLEQQPQSISDPALLKKPVALAWLGDELWILDQSQAQLLRYADNQLQTTVCGGTGNFPTQLLALNQGLLYSANSRGVVYAQIDSFNRQAKTHPQVLLAGFDPMLIDNADNHLRIIAVVEEGVNPLTDVGYEQDGGLTMTNMTLVGKIPLDGSGKHYGLVYEHKLSFEPNFLPQGSIANLYNLSVLIGTKRSQFSFRAFDTATNRHQYPVFEYRHEQWLSSTVSSPGMAVSQPPYAKHGARRQLPQVILAGFSPMYMNVNDEELAVMAVVRAGSSPLQSVTLNNLGDNSLVVALDKVLDLDNGDQLYRQTVLKKQNNQLIFSEEPQEIVWTRFFTIIAQDQNGQSHRFPDVQIGDFPAVE